MKIYTLTFTDIQKSLSPIEVTTFLNHEKARNKMLECLQEHLKKCGIDVPISELDNPKGYNNNDIIVGHDYASDEAGIVLWEIFTTEISMRDLLIGQIMEYIHETYKTPITYDNTLYRLINEYSNDDLMDSTSSISDFVEEHIIGEALYQNALAELGGKNGDYYYGIIVNYLNESDSFYNHCYDFFSNENKSLEDYQRWFIGMLCLCDGNSTLIKLVRKDIDDGQCAGDKIFEIEDKKEIVKENSYILCKNHREKCLKLNDEQYYDIMSNIINYKFKFGYGKNFYEQAVHLEEEILYVVFNVIKNHGIDDILNSHYGSCIELTDTKEKGWIINLVGSSLEIASMADELKIKYNKDF